MDNQVVDEKYVFTRKKSSLIYELRTNASTLLLSTLTHKVH